MIKKDGIRKQQSKGKNMRRPIIAGNWKMFKIKQETLNLIEGLKEELKNIKDIDVVVCPPFTSLCVAQKALKGSNIALGAQDTFWEEKGAYTGEISPVQLKDIGCEFVIVGHSERRQIFGETDEMINKKIISAMKNDLVPILCVGETLSEREENKTKDVVISQLKNALKNVSIQNPLSIIVAYEPVWAIGTGKNASSADAKEVIEVLRDTLSKIYNDHIANNVRIQYGGSVTPGNILDFAKEEEIDGALVGGASLDVASFSNIVKIWEKEIACVS